MTIDNVPTISKENGEEVVRYLNNVPRGIRERGLWKEGLRGKCQKAKGTKGSKTKSCCAETLLANQPDFLEQECQIAEVVKAGGHLCLFLPKYHCELNIIEFFWDATKNHTRECCDFTLDG
jgi:transposase